MRTKLFSSSVNKHLFTICPHHVVSTFRAGQHKARIGHVVPQVHVSPAAEDTAPLLERDVGLYGDGVGADHRPIGSTLTLDFPAFSISVKQN